MLGLVVPLSWRPLPILLHFVVLICLGFLWSSVCTGGSSDEIESNKWCPNPNLCVPKPKPKHIALFDAFKDFSVPCDVEDFEPTEEMMSFWARPSIACTQDVESSEIEELYGMYGREGDADSEVEEDLIQPTTVFKATQQPKKDPHISSGGFRYYVDATLVASMQDGTMSGCCVNSGLFAAGMVSLFRGTRQICWRVSATLQASKYVLFTIMHTTSVDYKTAGCE